MKVVDNDENFQKCLCAGCPTYNDCMKEKGAKLFCAKSKTECKLEQNGCLCGECPIASQYGLKQLYYCVKGAE